MTDSSELNARFAKVPVSILSDVMRYAGISSHLVRHDIRPIGPCEAFAGPAFCVKGEQILGGALTAAADRRFEMFCRQPSGALLVLASGEYEPAVVFGENVALALQVRGCAGIITDGGIRDRDAIVGMKLPVCARFVTPLSSSKQWVTTGIDIPVTLPGQMSSFVEVNPGDMVVCDGDGIAIVPKRGAVSILEDAEAVLATEGQTRDRILRGEDPEAVYGALPRFKHVRPV